MRLGTRRPSLAATPGHPGQRRAVAAVMGGVFALAVSVAALALSVWTDGGAASRPDCARYRLAAATGFRHDPALAIAVSRSVAAASPYLVDLVEATAAHQARYPDVESVTVGPDMPDADPSLVYVTVVADLASRPDLATPEVLTALESAAHAGGIAGVHSLIVDTGTHPPDLRGGAALTELRALVANQRAAVTDAGMVGVPSASCRAR